MLERWINGENCSLLKGLWEVLQGPRSSFCKGQGLEGAEGEENFLGLGKGNSGDLHEPSLAGTLVQDLEQRRAKMRHSFCKTFLSWFINHRSPL